MNVLKVEIVTPERAIFSGQAAEVVIPAWDGEMGVLPDHDAVLSLLRCGVATVKTDSGVKSWVIGRGFADVGGDHVTILTDQARDVAALDKDAARKQLAEAQAEMTSDSVGSESFKQAQIRAEWAQAQLDA